MYSQTHPVKCRAFLRATLVRPALPMCSLWREDEERKRKEEKRRVRGLGLGRETCRASLFPGKERLHQQQYSGWCGMYSSMYVFFISETEASY